MKLLGILDPSKAINRIIRRAVAIGVLTFIAVMVTGLIPESPALVVPILTAVLTAILASIDKLSREIKPSVQPNI